MFSDDELTSYFKIHLKYRDDDGKYLDQLRKLESAHKEISEWPRKTILHFSMIVASRGYQGGEWMPKPHAWGYRPGEFMQSPQSSGYQAWELLQRPQTWGYWTGELMQRPQPWRYWTGELMLRPQAWGYQARRLMHGQQAWGYQSNNWLYRPQVWGYREKTFMHRPQAWEYQVRELMQRPQASGYQAEEWMRRPQGRGYQAEEWIQKLQTALNSNEISLFPSCSYFPSLKGKFTSRQKQGDKMLENHAEHLLIDKLYVYFSVLENELKILRDINGHSLKVNLELTQNYSPCKDCVTKIVEFQNICRDRYNCDIDISITFATFYQFFKFHRFDYGQIFEDYRNKGELVNLQKSGVQLYLIDDRLREKIKTLLVEVYNIPEETMKTWVMERKLWDVFYMKKIKDESNIILSPFVPNFSQYI